MGVRGLWSILEPAGKTISLETLENQILAIDISLWLHQSVKGFRDKSGSVLPNAHLLGLFHRICKLLFYGIKPVFVFDGRAPALKRETLLRRRLRKSKSKESADKTRIKVLDNYVKAQVVAQKLQRQTHAMGKALHRGQEGLANLLSKRTRGQDPETDIFHLPPLKTEEGEEEDEEIDDEDLYPTRSKTFHWITDIHQVDVESEKFREMPKEEQYDLLLECKERRKLSSWNQIETMPQRADSFSGFQVERLLKRAKIHKTMNKVEKELGEKELQLLDPNLFVGDKKGLRAKRMASNSHTHILYGSVSKKDVETNQFEPKEEENDPKPGPSSEPFTTKESLSSSFDKEETERALLPQMIHHDAKDICNDDVILEPTLEFDNRRCGGKIDGLSININDNSVLSEESSDNEEFEEVQDIKQQSSSQVVDDLFADVFQDQNDLTKLDNIISKENRKRSLKDETTTTTTMTVIKSPKFRSEISEQTTLKSKEEIKISKDESFEKNSTPIGIKSLENEDTSLKNDEHVDISNMMRNSEHTWLKLASKHASPSKTLLKTPTSPSDVVQSTIFDKESSNLIQEMKTSEKEQKLLRFTNKSFQSKETPSMESAEPGEPYSNNTVYGSSVPGFVRSGSTVIEVSNDVAQNNEDIMRKLNGEQEEDVLDNSELLHLQEKLAKEQKTLVAEAGKQERLAASITDQMYSECQELLQIFGIPWIVSPGEAEAQCARLETLKLTNGTVTDDSDVWVFGSNKVYKNFFNQEKYVEFFSRETIVAKLGLTREQMINVAMLTGSDYTDGIENVGPITALEIIAEFPGNDLEPLQSFKKWWEESQKNGFKPGTIVKEKFKRLKLNQSFPDSAIFEAYIRPSVDDSTEKFSWAVPNFVAVNDFAREKFSWTRLKIDEMLKPILKRLNARITQTRIDNFFLKENLYQREMKSKRGLAAIEKVKKSPEKKKSGKSEILSKIRPNSKGLQKSKNEKAKEKAIQVMKKVRKGRKRPVGKTLARHNLSESDSD